MKIFVAGGSGTIGVPLVRALVSAGHNVTAMTRSPEKQAELRALGATPVLADAFDAEALRVAMLLARPHRGNTQPARRRHCGGCEALHRRVVCLAAGRDEQPGVGR